MMNEARPFASLSGSLLARKGGAKPAMRPRPLSTEQMLDDLGWDDMGDAHTPTEHVPSSIAALTPAPKPVPSRDDAPVVREQQRALVDHFSDDDDAEPEDVPAPVITRVNAVPQSEPVAKDERRPGAAKAIVPGKKAAFTLRLDADRHLRLRLANAVTGQSSQQIVTRALDAFLEALPEIGALARQLPGRAPSGN